MKFPVNLVIRQFLRTYTKAFSVDDFSSMLSKIGMKASRDECVEFLEVNPCVFSLSGGNYITRASTFTKQYFSFKPTRREIDRGVFIAGHRCMPFVDPEILSCGLTFVYKGKTLPQTVVPFPSRAALDLFCLYGDEFSVQYIAADPANSSIKLAETDFLLPPEIKMTAYSIENIVRSEGFSCGDRLVCRVTDWDAGVIEVKVQHCGDNPFEKDINEEQRDKWFCFLEKFMKDSFDTAGPCSSIEEQLALVFAENRDALCTSFCGSVEELMAMSRGIGFETFGVETRIWRKNEDVPAVGEWNSAAVKQATAGLRFENGFFNELVPQFMEDLYLKNMIFTDSEDFQKVFNDIYPYMYKFSREQKDSMLLHLKNRHDILLQSYNRFADFEVGNIRRSILEFYTVVNELVCSIDFAGSDLTSYPQQPLVILSQIFGHIIHIMEMIEKDQTSVIKGIDEIYLSLEGMKCNFDDISGLLRQVIDRNSRDGFSVLK